MVGSEAGVTSRCDAPGWRTGEDILVLGGYDWQGGKQRTDARVINKDFVISGEYEDQ